MSNKEIVKEIDEAMESLRETKRKIGGAFSKARNIVIKDSTVDTEAYNKGLEDGRNEVWELAKKIVLNQQYGGLSIGELKKIFGFGSPTEILRRYTLQEALAELEAYEKEQNEIKVGDVVEATSDRKQYLVITEENDNSAFDFGVINLNTMVVDRICNNTRCFKKTSKHIDIQSMLQQIGGKYGENQ